MKNNLDILFLESLEPDNGIPKEVDVTDFMMKNFDVPNLEDISASYYDTDALRFLRKSDTFGYFNYRTDVILPILNKSVYKKSEKEIRYWFDSVKRGRGEALYARITDLGLQHLYEYRTSEILRLTNNSIVDTNKALKRSINFQIGTGIITTVAIALTAIYAVMAYKKDDPPSLVQISKSMQRQEQLLDSIQQLQKERNIYLQKEAKKTSPTKP